MIVSITQNRNFSTFELIFVFLQIAGLSTMTSNPGNRGGQDDETVKTQGQAPEVQSNESPFVKLVRGIKIEDLEKETKEEDGTTSLLSRFKEYQKDLTNMAKDATITSARIVSFVMNPKRVGLTDEDDATLFVIRLREAHPVPAGM